MKLAEALDLAHKAVGELRPYCHRIEIAGSIRRKKPQVGDIELVCIPMGAKLFRFVDAVNKWPRIKGLPTGKYTQREYHGIKIDLFICNPKTWACNFAIRTGSAEFSHGLAIRAREIGLCFKNAQLWRMSFDEPRLSPLSTYINEEVDVFTALRIKWVEPENRLGARDVVPLKDQ